MRSHRTRTSALRAVTVWFVASRAGVLLVGALVAVALSGGPPPNESATWRLAAHPLPNMLARWDTFWYLDITAHGYRWNGNPADQQNVVFFPLYPLLMRIGATASGGQAIWIGLIISLAAFFASLLYFWRWSVDIVHDEGTATLAVAVLCVFPFAVFFSAVYTESLFLLTALGALFHINRDEPGKAAGWALVAGFVRPNGCLLAIPVAWIARSALTRGRSQAARSAMTWAAVLVPFIGPLAFSLYLRASVGQPFAWVADQAAWPTIAPWGHASTATPTAGPGTPVADVVVHVGNAAAIVFAVAGLVPVARLAGTAYALFVAVNIAPPLVRHGLLSMGRFTAVLFPLFLWLAWSLRDRPRARTATLVACAAGQAVAAALFFAWRPLV